MRAQVFGLFKQIQANAKSKWPVVSGLSGVNGHYYSHHAHAQAHSHDQRKMPVWRALNAAIAEEMERDENVFLIGENVGLTGGAHKVSRGLHIHFGDKRVIDTPITEMGFTGMAVGAAMTGGRPICEFMTFNFALQSIDHIINSAAKTCYMSAGRISVPIVFRGPNGFALGVGAQHTQNFASWFAHCPGLKVIAPYSSEDAKGLLKSAIRDPDPVIFLEHEILYDTVFEMSHEALSSEFLLPIGKAKIEREGNGVTLVSYARGVEFCLEAAQDLASQHGIEATVINLRTLRPLDMSCILESLAKTGHIVLVEEDWPFCGISAEISARICENPDTFKLLKSPVARVSCADLPTPYVKTLETLTIPTRKDICNVVLKSVKFSK